MAAKPDRARKLIVRSALVTSSTVATLIGAQNLAMLDASRFQPAATTDAVAMVATTSLTGATAETAALVQQAAPSIIILRRPGQPQTQSSPASAQSYTAPAVSTNIQPPSPVQMAAPAPQVVQQQVNSFQSAPAPRTRSSR